MKSHLLFFAFIILVHFSCGHKENSLMAGNKTMGCDESCMDKGDGKALSCKLTSPELQQRKATVIASLKKQLLEKKELENGYIFTFNDSDSMIDELTSFIKTERQCCDFFDFGMTISAEEKKVWLAITGPKGAKEFITTELGL